MLYFRTVATVHGTVITGQWISCQNRTVEQLQKMMATLNQSFHTYYLEYMEK